MLQRTHTGRPAAVTKAPKTDLCTTLNDAGVLSFARVIEPGVATVIEPARRRLVVTRGVYSALGTSRFLGASLAR